jgi:uncharacterized damage-inducible protein DinB
MAYNIAELFLAFSVDKLKQNCTRIQDCLAKLTAEQVWLRGSENQNSVGNLVLHLCGNIKQWIGTGIGGAPDTRDRDSEFAAKGGLSPADLSERLAQTVAEILPILRNVTAEQLCEVTRVQNYERSKLEAIYHVVEHFSGHTGQIIFATKLLTGEDLGYYKHLSSRTAAANLDNTP